MPAIGMGTVVYGSLGQASSASTAPAGMQKRSRLAKT